MKIVLLLSIPMMVLSGFSFGKTKSAPDESVFVATQEVPQQKLSPHEVEKKANALYKHARKQFDTKQFWQCSTDLISIVDNYAGYSKMAEVIYLLGKSLYELQVYSGADKMFRYLLREIEKNRFVPAAILGLQKCQYQLKDYHQSLKFYKALENHYPYFKGIDEARYYAGQTYFHLDEFNFALNVFQQVNSKSDFYPFSLYTTGLIQLKKKAFVRPSVSF